MRLETRMWRWLLPPAGLIAGWAAGATAGAPAPGAWTLAGVGAWLAEPFNWAFMVVGLCAGIGAYVALRDYFEPKTIPPIDLSPVTTKLEEMIGLIRQGALSPADARQAATLAVRALHQGGDARDPLIESFADTIAAVSQSPESAAREAVALELSGKPDEAFDQLMKLGELEAQHTAQRFRQAGALAAPTNVKKAIQAYARASDLEPENFWTWINLYRLHGVSGSSDAALRCLARAEQYAETDRDQVVVHTDAGDAALSSGDLPAAGFHFRRASEAAEQRLDADQTDCTRLVDASICYNRLACLAVASQNWDEARKFFSKAIERVRTATSRFPQEEDAQRHLAIALGSLADMERLAGQANRAKVLFDEVASIFKKLAAAHPQEPEALRDLAIAYNKIGSLAKALGDADGARHSYEADLAISERLVKADPHNMEWQRDLSVTLITLGDLEIDENNTRAAQGWYDRALTLRTRLVKMDRGNAEWIQDLAEAHMRLAEVYEANDKYNDAIKALRKAHRMMVQLVQRWPDHPHYAPRFTLIERRLAELKLKTG